MSNRCPLVKRETYEAIIHGGFPHARSVGIRGKAMTMYDYEERQKKKPCAIFRGTADVCERPRCGHPRAAHARASQSGQIGP